MPLCLRLRFTGFVPRRIEDLGALALALLAEALDLVLALLQRALAPAHLFLGAAKLGRGRGLCIPLDRVGHVGGGADHVERVHPDGVAGRLHLAAASGRLEHAQLHLELGRMASEGFEGLLDALRIETTAREGRQLLVYSTFRLEHTVMPHVSFETARGSRVFLLGDAAVSLPFFRGMACLASCAHALARAHESGQLDAYEGAVARIVREELSVVRGRARLVRGLRELVRISSMLPFPIQSWWLSAARPRVADALSPGAYFNLVIAAAALAVLASGVLSAWLAALSFPIELAGGFAYRWTLALEPGPHRYVRRIWEVQIALVLMGGVVLALARLVHPVAAAAWWLLGLTFVLGIYAFEGTVGRSLSRAQL